MTRKEQTSPANSREPINSSRNGPPGEENLTELEIGNTRYLTRFTEKFRRRKTWESPEPEKLVPLIPGTVQKILVSEGMDVDQGTPLIILEAMKMRNELLSPVKGRIRKIHISEGEKVPRGKLLLEIRQV